MAIGSVGQYLEDASVENVVMDDVKVIPGLSPSTITTEADSWTDHQMERRHA